MSKIRERVEELERQVGSDRQVIQSLEAKFKVGYGEWYSGGFGPVRAEVPVVDVVNSILRHLQLEIACKEPTITTRGTVKLRSINKEVAKKEKTSKSSLKG